MVTTLRRSVDAARAGCAGRRRGSPVARSRLWAIAAHRIQAELAPKRPEGQYGPGVRR